jgi:hypothetical protein
MLAEGGEYISWVERSLATSRRQRCKLRLIEGDGVVDPETDIPAPFTEELARLDALLARGAIEARDLKVRFASYTVRPEATDMCLELRLGPTCYRECVRGIEHPEDARRRAALGQARHRDARRYLGCGLGVLLLLTTADGRVLLGVRAGNVYRGWLHGVSGWLPFERDVSRIDPVAHARTECEEELGLTDVGELELLGLVSYGLGFETELVFTAQLSNNVLEDLVYCRHWMAAADAYEHSEVILATPERFLSSSTGRLRPIIPSAIFGLRALATRHASA